MDIIFFFKQVGVNTNKHILYLERFNVFVKIKYGLKGTK